MPFVRCFIAVELPEDLKQDLNNLEATLKHRNPPVVKWVEPGGIHLTLKFLGEVPEEQIEEITVAMEDAATGVTPFNLVVTGVGAFPNMSRIQLIWVGVKGELEKLGALQKQVEGNMEQLGFPRENREFSPHLTLGRVRNDTELFERQKIGEILALTSFGPSRSFIVSAIFLIRSQLTRGGAIYTPLKEIELKIKGDK